MKCLEIAGAILSASQRYKIPIDVLESLISRESSFKEKAVSIDGAYGLTQIMPETANDLKADLKTIQGQVNAGAKYLSELTRMLYEVKDEKERVKLALASYNCGIGYVKKAISNLKSKNLLLNYDGVINEFRSGVEVSGKKPDIDQVLNYVKDIVKNSRTFFR